MNKRINTPMFLLGSKITARYVHDQFIMHTVDGKKGLYITHNNNPDATEWINYYSGFNLILTNTTASTNSLSNNLEIDNFYKFRLEEFDFVVCDNVLDYSLSWESTSLFLDKIKTLVRPYGQLFLSFKRGVHGTTDKCFVRYYDTDKIIEKLSSNWNVVSNTSVVNENFTTVSFLGSVKIK